tara:strand:+ start:17220 stop:17576 length:357 start_codon:yes stop_codon:yes gene_type:complete
MLKPLYASLKHEVIIRQYLEMNLEFVAEIAPKARYNNYLEVYKIVIEYHNNYGKGRNDYNYWDWLMVLPINVAILTNGFFAAIETKTNAPKINSYKTLLNNALEEVVKKIEKLDPENE